MKKELKMNLLISILFLLIGIILFTNPGGVIDFIAYIVGGIFLFVGLIYFVQFWRGEKKNIFVSEFYSGVISVVIGVILMFNNGALDLALRVFSGVWILYRAIVHLKVALTLKDQKDDAWKVSLGISIILFAGGLFEILVQSLELTIIGFVIILYSLFEIMNIIYQLLHKPKEEVIKKPEIMKQEEVKKLPE
jgi:uncharacterized membrane protein HdeD (DUF308 family)